MVQSSTSRTETSGLKMLLSSRLLQILLILFVSSCVFLFYSFSTSNDFHSLSKDLYNAEQKLGKHNANNKASPDFLEKQAQVGKDCHNLERACKLDNLCWWANQAQKHAEEFANDYHILFIFSKVEDNPKLKKKFNIAFGSLFEHAEFDVKETLHLHFVCDEPGRKFAQDYLQSHVLHPSFSFKVHFHNVSVLVKKILPVVKNLQESLGQKHPYYEDSIFFLSLALHKILPDYIHRIVQLDVDLKFDVNIRELWKEFSYFKRENLIGIAYENQPVYRHILWKYRNNNPGTLIGNPAPDGHPGFNSGVMLLHLDHMRSSYLYNSYLDVLVVNELVEKYSFKGHLGDQDFYTLLGFEKPSLFHVLPCTWNRQLCQWWKNKGYENIFHKYYDCLGKVKIWHGNCNTPIP